MGTTISEHITMANEQQTSLFSLSFYSSLLISHRKQNKKKRKKMFVFLFSLHLPVLSHELHLLLAPGVNFGEPVAFLTDPGDPTASGAIPVGRKTERIRSLEPSLRAFVQKREGKTIRYSPVSAFSRYWAMRDFRSAIF